MQTLLFRSQVSALRSLAVAASSVVCCRVSGSRRCLRSKLAAIPELVFLTYVECSCTFQLLRHARGLTTVAMRYFELDLAARVSVIVAVVAVSQTMFLVRRSNLLRAPSSSWASPITASIARRPLSALRNSGGVNSSEPIAATTLQSSCSNLHVSSRTSSLEVVEECESFSQAITSFVSTYVVRATPRPTPTYLPGIEFPPSAPSAMPAADRDARRGFLDQNFVSFAPRSKKLLGIRRGTSEAIVDLELDATFVADLATFAYHTALLDMATGAAQSHVRLRPESFPDAASFDIRDRTQVDRHRRLHATSNKHKTASQ